MTKDEIRVKLRRVRDNLSQEEKMVKSKAIHACLVESIEYQFSDLILAYVSFRNEVDTTMLIRQALSDHKKVYVPKVENPVMEFYEIKSLEELHLSAMGILEPLGSEESRFVIDSFKGDNPKKLMLLPGLAFDEKGNRIGYGAGYYDRYLAKQGEDCFIKIGLCYEFQRLQEIETHKFDIKMDKIITPKDVISCCK